jgi:CPA1 family monovalent cation:H+ antiporter
VQPILFAWTRMLSWANAPFLTWAGVRGGISVALALSLPDNPAKSLILAATYAVVLFSIIVQGSTLGIVTKRTVAGAGKGSGA